MASFELIVSFASAARHASFASAARDLGLSPSAIAKNVARLESHLGVRLFHRTTRQVTLSPDGEEFYARCQRILDEVESLDAAAAGAHAGLRGTLRIDMPATYGRQVVLPVLARLKQQHAELKIDARFTDHVVDIVKEGLDAAVRIGKPADNRLVARMFDQQVILTCASPAYLEQHGEPRSPDKLAGHACLVFRNPSTGRDRPWEFRVGRREVSLTPASDMRLGDGEALVQAAVAGLGLIQIPSYIAGNDVKRGTLVEVLRKHRPAPLPISLVYPGHRHIPPRVRALADALAQIHAS